MSDQDTHVDNKKHKFSVCAVDENGEYINSILDHVTLN